ncbi:MAG: hypothetical protein H7062_22330 [Candidatus Saccharimonas sp.]|nr:hypothetical protein [Planctomycetaceae bacterium]
MEVASRDIHAKPIRRWVRSTLLWFVAASCCTVTIMTQWDGTKSSERAFEQLLEDSKSADSAIREIAIECLRVKATQGIDAIRSNKEREDRSGMLAKNALKHLRNEAAK